MLTEAENIVEVDPPVIITMVALVGDPVDVAVSRLDIGRQVILFGAVPVAEFLDAVVGESPTPLRTTEAWFALEATQSVAVPGLTDTTAGFGLRTRWADEDR